MSSSVVRYAGVLWVPGFELSLSRQSSGAPINANRDDRTVSIVCCDTATGYEYSLRSYRKPVKWGAPSSVTNAKRAESVLRIGAQLSRNLNWAGETQLTNAVETLSGIISRSDGLLHYAAGTFFVHDNDGDAVAVTDDGEESGEERVTIKLCVSGMPVNN